ncbi:hypothetical protein WH87_00585 [Devosia epidermidihirudinis]|uniref:DUF1499 domain-containing protein n=1 Tax=Devosia epidermidihirudinis TaxID=1293439 RepID=A0A0F5QN44_9HYPH|nr:hypothetical protein WH87_00585 [Devosia epidermidihirudinis]
MGTLAIPLVVISVLLHRIGILPSNGFMFVAGLTLLVALFGVIAAFVAMTRLWFTGDQGWSKALIGLALSLVALLPFVWYGSLAMRYPAVTDIYTTDRAEMPLVFDAQTMSMPQPKTLSAAQIARVFPNVQTRDYPLGLTQTFGLVRQLVEDRGWDVRVLREPTAEFEPGRINARIVTLVGWREEAVIRVTGNATDSEVNMRSASLNALHDFGDNGLRVEEFLTALDDAVTGLMRDNPDANTPIEEQPETD